MPFADFLDTTRLTPTQSRAPRFAAKRSMLSATYRLKSVAGRVPEGAFGKLLSLAIPSGVKASYSFANSMNPTSLGLICHLHDATKWRAALKRLIDEFFEWVTIQCTKVKDERGLLPQALGYAMRQEAGLRAFLREGRWRMDNNLSEAALKLICTGRSNWLFFGFDDRARVVANLLSLIACCHLHDIDPERYLPDVIHVMPIWPRDRYLGLDPAYCAATRARLNPSQLANKIGPITVPSRLTTATEHLASNFSLTR